MKSIDLKKRDSDKKVDHWIQLYLQAKISGDTAKIKIYGSILLKLGVKLPK